jgi:hypothetical protein
VTVNYTTAAQEQRFRVVYTLVNALFDGLEFSEKVENGTGRRLRDNFTWTSPHHSWTLRWLPEYELRTERLRAGIWPSAPTSTISTSGVSTADLDSIDKEIDAICWLLSVAIGCPVAAPLRQLWHNDVLVEERLEPRSVHSSARTNTHYELISNHEPPMGLKQFLENSLDPFLKQQDSLRLTDFIGWMNQARSQRVIQVKAVAGILAIELISYAWVTSHGLSAQQAETANIETKLNRMRKDGMHFIEKRFTATDLRSGFRNPLIHTGLIPLMDAKEVHAWAEDLYHLAFRILMFVLGYKGEYRDLTNNYKLVAAP